MFGNTSRTRLGELRQRLDKLHDLNEGLPARAEDLREEVRWQRKRVDRLESPWWRLWPSDPELRAIEAPLADLEAMVEPLRALDTRAKDLAEQVGLLEPQVGEIADPELESWWHAQLRGWRAELDTLGRHAKVKSQPSSWNRVLDERAEQIQLVSQLCYQLRKTAEIVASPDLGEEGGALARELLTVRGEVSAQLRQTGPSAEQVERLKTAMLPLERLVTEVRETRSRLEGLGERLQTLRGWSRELGGLERGRIEVLENERQQLAFATAGDDSAVADWLTRADQLRLELVKTAGAERQAQLQELESRMEAFVAACGTQPELARRIRELGTQVVEHYHQHKEWQLKHDRQRDFFQSIAKNYEHALEERLQGHVERLEERLRELRQKTLLNATRASADQLGHELGEVGALRGVEGSLGGLRQAKELEHRLAGLDTQADTELRELVEQCESLRQRFGELRTQETRLGLELEDLEKPIEKLVASDKALEVVREEAVELEEKVRSRQRALLEQCRGRVGEHERAARRAARLLAQVRDAPAAPRTPIVIADDATPTMAVEAVLAAETLRTALETEVETELAEVETRRQRLAAELAAIVPSGLGPSERADAEQIRSELEAGSWMRARDPQERLERLAEVVEKCELLFERLRQDEIRAGQRHADLLERLQRFDEAHLRGFCPELSERVEALLHGVPERTRDWRGVLHQLEQAAELMGRLESHGRRLAAAEFERALGRLRARPESRTEPALQNLLTRLAEGDPHELPPTSLRMRARQEAERFEEVS